MKIEKLDDPIINHGNWGGQFFLGCIWIRDFATSFHFYFVFPHHTLDPNTALSLELEEISYKKGVCLCAYLLTCVRVSDSQFFCVCCNGVRRINIIKLVGLVLRRHMIKAKRTTSSFFLVFQPWGNFGYLLDIWMLQI